MSSVLKIFKLLVVLFLWVGFHACSGSNPDENEEQEGNMEELSPEETRASPLRKVEGEIGNKSIKVQYGSPAVKDREVWGDLVPYDEVWRTGANEATFIEVDQDVLIEGEPLKAGKYSLFTIPRENGPWTLILNEEWDLEHGHFQYNEEHDVLRVDVNPEWQESNQESLTIEIAGEGLEVQWEKLKLPISIE